MQRILLLVLALALLVILPFLFWGDAIETALSPESSADWFRSFGSWAWAVGIGLMVADVALPLTLGCGLHRNLIKPEIGDMELLIEVARMPTEGELHRLIFQLLLTFAWPGAFLHKVSQGDLFTSPPDAG